SIWLKPTDCFGSDQGNIRNSIGNSSFVDRFESWKFFFPKGYDKFATSLIWKTVGFRVGRYQLHAATAQTRLEAAGFIVQTGMHDSRIMSGLMGCHCVGFFKDRDRSIRKPSGDLVGDSCTIDPGTDHCEGRRTLSRHVVSLLLSYTQSFFHRAHFGVRLGQFGRRIRAFNNATTSIDPHVVGILDDTTAQCDTKLSLAFGV